MFHKNNNNKLHTYAGVLGKVGVYYFQKYDSKEN
jgi:hypothetical protein